MQQQINKQLIEKEKELANKLLKNGFRSTKKKMDLTIKLYNSLCNKCKHNILNTGLNNPKERVKIFGNSDNYCDICKEKVKDTLEKLSIC